MLSVKVRTFSLLLEGLIKQSLTAALFLLFDAIAHGDNVRCDRRHEGSIAQPKHRSRAFRTHSFNIRAERIACFARNKSAGMIQALASSRSSNA